MLPATHARLGYAAVAVGRSSVSRSALSASGALLAAGRSTVAAGRAASTSARALSTATRSARPTIAPQSASRGLVHRRFMSSGSKSRYDVGVFTLPSAAVFVATGLGLVLYFRHEKQKLEEERGEWKSLTCVD
ncbi:hypothetical protein K523DRAFT_358771 [Schizophyllum commune Tattone D]|nr:hypothetical protein K523DRAFT_358771 [Schizophyllum commune Tattone D]